MQHLYTTPPDVLLMIYCSLLYAFGHKSPTFVDTTKGIKSHSSYAIQKYSHPLYSSTFFHLMSKTFVCFSGIFRVFNVAFYHLKYENRDRCSSCHTPFTLMPINKSRCDQLPSEVTLSVSNPPVISIARKAAVP